jgi:hypothetical protein
MNNATLRIVKDGNRWRVLGAPAAYGSSDSDQSPTVPPSFRTRRAARKFAGRVIDRGEASAVAEDR